ncbi:MAG: hypothetical protein JNL66_10560 [Alphaproteobacteria bacterium]|nr:hypothetical protein [Alphaproteobacteria bacterium]
MPEFTSRARAMALAVLGAAAVASCSPQPRWSVAPAAASALSRVDRTSVLGIICRADRQTVPCGDYLLNRLVPMLERRPEIRDLSIADANANCRPDGRGTICDLTARVRFVQDGRTWPLRVDMRYRAPEHFAYAASARGGSNPLANASDPALAPLRDVIDRLVASIALESERASRIRGI